MSDLLKARTAPDILTALARALTKLPCPAEAIPTPAVLAEWLHDCPEAAFVEATARLDAMTAGAAEWVWTVNRPLPGLSAPDMTPEVIAHDGYYIASVVNLHARWLDLPEDERPLHPLAPIVAAWQERPRKANTQRRDPILPRITIEAPDLARKRGELIVAPEGRAGLRAARMPLFPDAPHDDVQVPLLDLADVVTGERAVSGGHGAAHELRLLFEGVTGIGEAARRGDGELIAWTVGELLEAFYRGGGKVRRPGERPGDWELIRRACQWVSGAAIPWRVPSGNVQPWAIMTLRSLPGERPALSDPVVFDVRLPPGAGVGPAVDRPALREAGRVSSPAFRIGVAVPSVTWIPGKTRRPVPGVGGLWIGDASRYPVLSARDRRRIVFGPDDQRKPHRIDATWRKAADAAGVKILETEAVDRDGKRGWIVVPKAAAEAIRAARERVRK